MTLQLESKDPADRIRAVHAVGQERLDALLPALVNRLDDDDVAVRLYAIVALEKMTGQRLGYAYAAESGDRQEAVTKWRRFIADRAATFGGPGDGGDLHVEPDQSGRNNVAIEEPLETRSAG